MCIRDRSLHDVREDRPVAEGKERLRAFVGQRAETDAPPAGRNQDLHVSCPAVGARPGSGREKAPVVSVPRRYLLERSRTWITHSADLDERFTGLVEHPRPGSQHRDGAQNGRGDAPGLRRRRAQHDVAERLHEVTGAPGHHLEGPRVPGQPGGGHHHRVDLAPGYTNPAGASVLGPRSSGRGRAPSAAVRSPRPRAAVDQSRDGWHGHGFRCSSP